MKILRLALLPGMLALGAWNYAAASPSGAPTLQNLIGGRAGGMAEAFSTIGNDVTAWPYNPATLASLKGGQAATTFSRGFASDYFSTLSYAQPTSFGTFAGSFGYYDTGSEKLYGSDGSEFNVHLQRDILGAVSYAASLGAAAFGASGKFLSSELAEAKSASAFAVDFGVIVRPPSSGLAFGLALRNVGSGIKFIQEKDPLPMELRLGSSYLLPMGSRQYKMLLSADVPYLVNEKDTMVKVGAELAYLGSLSLQAGYNFNSDAQGLTLGAGVLLGKINVNYGLGLTEGLSDVHRITVGYRFGETTVTPTEDKVKVDFKRI